MSGKKSLFHRVGVHKSITSNVIYHIVQYGLEFGKLPGYIAGSWCGLRNSRWHPRWLPYLEEQGYHFYSNVIIVVTI